MKAKVLSVSLFILAVAGILKFILWAAPYFLDTPGDLISWNNAALAISLATSIACVAFLAPRWLADSNRRHQAIIATVTAMLAFTVALLIYHRLNSEPPGPGLQSAPLDQLEDEQKK